jgi:hypothetical protein
MPLLLHAITLPSDESGAAARDPDGFGGSALSHTDLEGMTAWASEVAVKAFTREDLLDHHRVVSEVFARVEACLPARLPTWVDDVLALERLLVAKGPELLGRLERVKGCAELAVTAVWTTAEEITGVDAATPGRRYLLERQLALEGSDRRHVRGRELARHLELLAGDDLVEVQQRVCPSVAIALSSALLVRRPRADYLKARLRRTEQDVRILVHGPWPPYSFAGIGSE